MHPFLPHGETLVLHRRVPRVENGEKVYDAYGVLQYDTVDAEVEGCAVWPFSSSETLQNQERTNTQYSAALPAGTEVDAVDYVTWRGLDYELNGEPDRYHRNPITGSVGPVVINMLRVEG